MDSDEEFSKHTTQIVRGGFWGIFGNICLKLISFIYLVIVARVVSQNDVGTFYLALSILTIPSIIDDLGLTSAISRYVPFLEGRNERAKIKGLLKFSTLIVSLSGLIFSIIFFLGARQISEAVLKICFESLYPENSLVHTIKILAPFLFFNNLLSLFTNYLQSRFAIKESQLVFNLQNAVKLLLTLMFFYVFGYGVFSLSLGFIVAAGVVVIVSIYFVIKSNKDLPHKVEEIDRRMILKEIMPFGLILGLISSMGSLMTSSDKILLAFFINSQVATQTIASYSIAVNMAGLLSIISGGLGGIFFPLVSKLAGKEDHMQIKKVLQISTRWLLFSLIPVAVVFISFSEEIIRYLYGSEYVNGATSLAIIVTGMVVGSAFYMLTLAIGAIRKLRYEAFVVIAGGVTNVVFNILLIPVFGMNGAAIALAISYLVISGLLAYYGKKLFDFSLPTETIKILVSGIVAFLILYCAHAPLENFFSYVKISEQVPYVSKILYLFLLGILTAISIIVFVAVAIILKAFKKEDVGILDKILSKSNLPPQLINKIKTIFAKGIAD